MVSGRARAPTAGPTGRSPAIDVDLSTVAWRGLCVFVFSIPFSIFIAQLLLILTTVAVKTTTSPAASNNRREANSPTVITEAITPSQTPRFKLTTSAATNSASPGRSQRAGNTPRSNSGNAKLSAKSNCPDCVIWPRNKRGKSDGKAAPSSAYAAVIAAPARKARTSASARSRSRA